VSTPTRSSKKWDPGAMRGPSISAARRRGVATTQVTGGAATYGPGSSTAGGRGPRAGLHLPEHPIDAPRGAGSRHRRHRRDAFRAPPGAGPRRAKALEVPGAARFAAPSVGAPMRRGPPAPGVHRTGTFAMFLLPGGRPRRFAPEPGPAAMEEAEGSIARGSI
jgi:hypothetical protein